MSSREPKRYAAGMEKKKDGAMAELERGDGSWENIQVRALWGGGEARSEGRGARW